MSVSGLNMRRTILSIAESAWGQGRYGRLEAMPRNAYPSDLDDATYSFMLPYLLLVPEDAPQRVYPLREVLNAVLWVGAHGQSMGLPAPRFPALSGGPSASPALV